MPLPIYTDENPMVCATTAIRDALLNDPAYKVAGLSVRVGDQLWWLNNDLSSWSVASIVTSTSVGINQTTLAGGTIGLTYTQRITISGGVAPLTFAASGLPAGLSINASTGIISGTPTARNNGSVAVTVTDSAGTKFSRGLPLQVGVYSDKVKALFGSSLIGYWQLAEASGAAIDSSPTVSNGTHTSVTLGQPGIGDGQTSGTYTSAPVSFTSLFSTKLLAAFNPSEISMGCWVKVTDPAFWSATTNPILMRFGNSIGSEVIDIIKQGSGQLVGRYFSAGNTSAGSPINTLNGTNWFHVALSFSVSNNRIRFYLNGALLQEGIATTPMVTPINTAQCHVGATGATSTWQGSVAHAFVMNREVTPLEVQQLALIQPGIWTIEGTVLEASYPDEDRWLGEPNIIHDSNPMILNGDNVFKSWFTQAEANFFIGYAESYDAKNWTKWPIPVLTTALRPSVSKIGSTYWLVGYGGNNLDLYSSPDGIQWTLYQSNIILPSLGQWDSAIAGNSIIWQENGTWYLLYDACNVGSGGLYKIGLATSPDGHTWTKYSGNPVISGATSGPNIASGAGGPYIYKSSSNIYYCWAQCGQNGNNGPTDVVRFYSNSPQGPWLQSTQGNSLTRYSENSGSPNAGTGVGQVADISLCEYNKKTYMLFTAMPDQNSLHIELAISNLTLEQIVTTNEGNGQINTYDWLPNGSFEIVGASSTYQYWTDNADDGVITRTLVPSEVVKNSSRIAACKLLAGTKFDTKTSQLVLGLIPDRTYTFNGNARGDGMNAGRIRIQDTASVDLIAWPTTLTSGVEYQYFSITFIAPANGQVSVSCYCPAVSGGTSYFDDLSLRLA